MKFAELADNKLSILFFVNTLSVPLTNAHITEFFLKKYLMTYFDLQQMISGLVESGHLNYLQGRNSHYYGITNKGTETLDFFKQRIPEDVKISIQEYACENRDRIRNESQILADYTKINDTEYEVVLRVTEQESALMEIKLNVATRNHAREICENWKSRAPQIYKGLLESLISPQ